MKQILIGIVLFTGIVGFTNEKEINGKATYYNNKFVGRLTATGEVFSQKKMTGASNYFKLGSTVCVTNKRNGKSVKLRINDRTAKSTAKKGIIVDLTVAAAKAIGIHKYGIGHVKVKQM